jgi:hypothetical protein
MTRSHHLKIDLICLGVITLLISWPLPINLTDAPMESEDLPAVSSGPPPSSQPKESAACDSIREWLIHTGQDPIQDCAEFEPE